MARNLFEPGPLPAETLAGAATTAFVPSWAAAHDLAGGVRGIVQLCSPRACERDRPPGDADLRLLAIGRRARRLERVILELQELERAYPGGGEGQVAEPAAAVRAVVAELEPELAALRARLHLGWLPPLAIARADLERLLANLIGNALQHRAPVKPRLEIGCCRRGDAIELAVADNGPGVPEAMRERVFEPFFRLPSARAEPGPGLGLAICRAIVERYGGRIWAEAGQHGGSRFCCTLPAA